MALELPTPLPSEGPPIPAELPDSRSSANALVRATAKLKPEPEDDGEQEKKILELAHLRFRRSIETEAPYRRRATEELEFVDGLEHWSPAMKQERAGLPCLVFDRIGPSIDLITNAARQAPPEPRVSPVGDNADKDTADILQGLIRNIENDSGAEIAYMTAYEHAVKIGRGWWRVLWEYEDDETDAQKIVIRRVPNPFSVYPDPAAEQFDYSDMRYCFVTEDLDKDVYDDLYPDSQAASLAEFEGIGDRIKQDWFPNGAVRVAEYWWVQTERYQQATLADGSKMRLDQVPEGVEVHSTRTVEKRRARCAKINGVEVLDQWDSPGKKGWIPLIPVLGREVIEAKQGKRTLRGMVRPAMDANLAYDYMASKEVEAIALAPIAPFMVAEGQIEGYEEQYKVANRKAVPFLVYKTRSATGEPVAMPKRNVEEPAIQAITLAMMHRDNDLKATLNTWDASLGRPGPEFSGRAIEAQQRQGDNAHYNFADNLARSIRHTGRVILDLCPHIYSEQRLITIADPDGTTRPVPINQKFMDLKKGAERIYQIGEGIGRYDVVIGSGPSFATRRQHGANALLELVQRMPQPMVRALDLVVKALDIPDSDQLAERLRPPDVQVEKDGQMPVPPEAQQQMAQMQQMIQALTEQLNKAMDTVRTKSQERESAEWIAALNAQVKLITEDLKTGAQTSIAAMQEQFGAIRSELEAMRVRQEAERQQQQAEPPASPAAPAQEAPPPAAAPGVGAEPQALEPAA